MQVRGKIPKIADNDRTGIIMVHTSARCIVEVSQDFMLAKASFIPGIGDEPLLVVDDVERELREHGVFDCILWEVVRKTIDDCNNLKHPIRDVVVAKGQFPRPSIPECIIFPPRLMELDPVFLPPEKQEANAQFSAYFTQAIHANNSLHKDIGHVDEHGNIDFREKHGIVVVHEGQILAARRAPVEGIGGKNVRGEYLGFGELVVKSPEPGPNIKLEDGKYVSEKNGRFVFLKGMFAVDENLELKEDVGYKTGNIRFPGNLILKAGVKDHFKVWVGGNLEAVGVIDAYEVFAGANIDAKGGIIGRGKGVVRAKGSIHSKFVENCVVEALHSIELDLASLHAHIFASDTITTTEKGRIVGGRVVAKNKVQAQIIGNQSGTHTVVEVGQDYVIHRKIDFIKKKYQEFLLARQSVDERLSQIEKQGMRPPQSLLDQGERMDIEIKKHEDELGELADQLVDNHEAEIICPGVCYAGVKLVICDASLELTKDYKNTVFYYEPRTKQIGNKTIAGKA